MIRMIPYDSMHEAMTYRPSMQFHAWNQMISYMEVRGTIRFHACKGMERKAKIRNSQNFIFVLLACHFPETTVFRNILFQWLFQ